MATGKAAKAPRNQIAATRGAGMVVIKVLGAGNMVTAPTLTEFLDQQRASGFRRFIFDMQECRGLDSTFMGCMVGLCTALQRENPPLPAIGPGLPDDVLTALCGSGQAKGSPPPDEFEALEAVPMSKEEALTALKKSLNKSEESSGQPNHFDGFVIAVNVSVECSEVLNILGVDKFVRMRGRLDLASLETAVLPEKATTPEQRRMLILRAHENLIEIDKRNEAQFGAFLKSLSEELSKK